MRRVYLDYNATTPLRAEARSAMLEAMDVVGNPSSVHAEGRAAKAIVERARGQVAALVGCDTHDIVFTSSATEAARLAFNIRFSSVSYTGEARHVICADIEHDCITNLRRAGVVAVMPVDAQGRVDNDKPEAAAAGLFEYTHGGHVFALQTANSETGVQQDVGKEVVGIQALDATETAFLTDVTQSTGKVSVDFSGFNADMAVCSAHKFGGPKGVGALVLKTGADVEALIRGGGQEMGRRSGTENVIGIAGFGAAAAAAKRDVEDGNWDRVEKLRNILEKALADISEQTIFVGKDVPRLPNTSCFITPGWKGETQVMQMDLAGFAISAGSACSSGKVKPSRVLKAMGYTDEEAASAVRVSLGLETTEEEVLRFVEAWARSFRKHEARAA